MKCYYCELLFSSLLLTKILLGTNIWGTVEFSSTFSITKSPSAFRYINSLSLIHVPLEERAEYKPFITSSSLSFSVLDWRTKLALGKRKYLFCIFKLAHFHKKTILNKFKDEPIPGLIKTIEEPIMPHKTNITNIAMRIPLQLRRSKSPTGSSCYDTYFVIIITTFFFPLI